MLDWMKIDKRDKLVMDKLAKKLSSKDLKNTNENDIWYESFFGVQITK